MYIRNISPDIIYQKILAMQSVIKMINNHIYNIIIRFYSGCKKTISIFIKSKYLYIKVCFISCLFIYFIKLEYVFIINVMQY